MKKHEGKALVVGFPSFYTSALIETLARRNERAVLLCAHGLIPSAKIWTGQFGRAGKMVEILEGDPARIDFALSGAEWQKLRDETRVVYHCISPGASRNAMRAAMEETLEICTNAPGLERLVLLSLCRPDREAGPRRGGENGKGPSPWDLGCAAAEAMLTSRPSGPPWTIIRCAVPAPMSPSFMPGRTTDIVDRTLQVLILLHCQLDLKTLKTMAARRMLLTPVETLAEAAVTLVAGDRAAGETLDLCDEEGFDITFLRQVIDSVTSNTSIAGADFTGRCRKTGPKLLDGWLVDLTPQDLLARTTTTTRVPSDRTRAILRECGIDPPHPGTLLVEAIKVNVRIIEESMRTLESRETVGDALG
jgi:hypothetical protein